MKKLLFLSFAMLSLANPVDIFAQIGEKTSPIIKNESDTVSYAYGVSLAQQGLYQYLIQMNIITDTLYVTEDYLERIEEAPNEEDRNVLASELRQKIDSIENANENNINQFLKGFNAGLDKSAYNFNQGIAVGSQITPMTERFAEEAFENAEDFNMDAFLAGFIGAIKNDSILTENSFEIVENKIDENRQNKTKKEEAERQAQYASSIEKQKEFLAKNKKQKGVVTLPSGLQYKVIKKGKGEKPVSGDNVTVNYEGKLIDGTVFDSSISRGTPATFGVDQVIKGWTEALKLMPKGSKWVLYIPSDLAYGANGAGTIKPYSTLIFEVELLDIESPEAQIEIEVAE